MFCDAATVSQKNTTTWLGHHGRQSGLKSWDIHRTTEAIDQDSQALKMVAIAVFSFVPHDAESF